jgi:beta-glucoside operon transcriptional antiterminator
VTADKSNELIVMGKGIAFNKKVGDMLDETKIDKIYRLANGEVSQKFQELLEDVPIEYLKISNELIDYAKKKLTSPLNESIYVSLTDHLYTAIERIKQGIHVRNILLWDIKRLYPNEYAIGKRVVEKILELYQIDLGEDEAGFIALHLVNAQTESGSEDVFELTEIIQEIIQLTKYYFKLSFDEESVYFYRFTTHLSFFARRIIYGKQHQGESDEELLLLVQKKYHNAYQCVLIIETFLTNNYSYSMSNDEKLYLTIHIARLVQKTE